MLGRLLWWLLCLLHPAGTGVTSEKLDELDKVIAQEMEMAA